VDLKQEENRRSNYKISFFLYVTSFLAKTFCVNFDTLVCVCVGIKVSFCLSLQKEMNENKTPNLKPTSNVSML
jgi:hypothetical protein